MDEKKKEKRKLIDKLTNKYRIVLLNDSTFEEVGFFRLTRLNVIAAGGIVGIIMVAIFWSLIAYTPIRELIPGYPDAEMRNSIIQNKIRLDSLEIEIQYRDQYFDNLLAVISGEKTRDYIIENPSTFNSANLDITRTESDSILREQVEIAQKLDYSGNKPVRSSARLESIQFFTPVNGMVTNTFDPMNDHFGTDVVAGTNEVVKAVTDGTVILASWTLETGHVIQIQHDNDLISVYKHNAELLKKVGMRVSAGDAIAIIGNSGEMTTGPHLHFELWQNGIPLNPQNFIEF